MANVFKSQAAPPRPAQNASRETVCKPDELPAPASSRKPATLHAAGAPRSTAGFTIAEVLLTVALVGLLTLAVAAGIGVALSAYTDIRTATEAQAVLDNAVTSVSDELRFAYDVETFEANSDYPSPNIEGGGSIYAFNSSIRGYRLYLGNSATGTSGSGSGTSRISLFATSAVPQEGTPAEASIAEAQALAGNAVESSIPPEGLPSTLPSITPLPLVNTDAGNPTASSDSRGNTTAFTAQLTKLSWDETTRLWTFTIEVTDGATTRTSGQITVRAVNNW